MRCNNCGAEIPWGSLFCLKCGSKVKVNVSTGDECSVKSFNLLGRNLTFYEDVLAVNKLRKQFAEYGWKTRNSYINFYNSNVRTFEDLFNKAFPKFVDDIMSAIKFGVFVLMDYGVDFIDEKELTNGLYDRIDLHGF